MRTLVAAAGLPLAVVLAGCSASAATTTSGAPAATSPAPSPRPSGLTQQELCDVLTSTVTPADLGAPVAGTRQASGAGGPSCEIDTAPVTMGDTVQPASVALAASSPGYLTNNGVPLSAQDLVEELKADGDCPAGLSTAAGRHAGRPTLTGLCGNDLGSYSGVKVYFFDGFSVAVTTTWAIRAGHRTQADVDAVADRVFDRLQQTA